jgi:preprotein translocase subunit SecG
MLIMRAVPAARWLSCAAAILLGLIIVLTILLLAPVNNRIARWDVGRLPTDWLSMRRHWDLFHRVRVLLLMVVLVLLILSVLLDRQGQLSSSRTLHSGTNLSQRFFLCRNRVSSPVTTIEAA